MKTLLMLSLSFAFALVTPGVAQAQKSEQSQTRDPFTQAYSQPVPERAYGWELMTDKERKEHQAKMRSLKTEQEREAFHAEHHKKMQERAKAQGKTLPDMPPAGRGPGQGQGQGQAPAAR